MAMSGQSLSFSALLKRYRRAAGLTQEQLAERAGYSAIYIRKVERGERVPVAATAELLADALALSAHECAAWETARKAAAMLGSPSTGQRVLSSLPPETLLTVVGRAHELGMIERHLANVGPPLVMLAGEPGIGKSRLLHEAARRGRMLGWQVVAGGCTRRSGQEPFAPFVGALARALSSQSAAQQHRTLRGCASLVRLLPELAESAEVPAPTWELPADQQRHLFFAALARFFANVAGPAGTLALLDDLQWASPDALDALEYLVRCGPVSPLRLLGSYRTTEVRAQDPVGILLADLARDGLVLPLEIGPLMPDETSALLEKLLGRSGIEARDEVKQRVLERAEGIPYFVVSWVQGMQAGARDGGKPVEGGELSVPWSVATTIRQRAGLLSARAQQLLRLAVIFGREVDAQLLLALTGRWGWQTGKTLVALEEVCQARLLVEADDTQVYRFAHDLIREVIATDLTVARRISLHQQVAEALEAMPGDPPVERLAYHFHQAGQTEKECVYLERAGDRAFAVYANAEAATHYRDLLQRFVGPSFALDEARIAEKLAMVVRAQGHYEQAHTFFQEAVDAFQLGGEREGQWRAVVEMGWLYFRRGMYVEGLAHLRPLLTAAERTAPPLQLVAVLNVLAAFERNAGQHRAALVTISRALELARTLGETVLQAAPTPTVSYGRLLLDEGRVEEAIELMDGALPLVEAAGNLQNLASALRILAAGYLLLGEFARSREYRERTLQIVERTGDQGYEMFQLSARGRLHFLSGNWHAARIDAEQAVTLYRQIGAAGVPPQPLHLLGELSLAEGHAKEAHALLAEGLARAECMGEPERLVLAHAVFAEWELLEGRSRAAQARLEPLLDPPDRDESFLIQLWTLLAWSATDMRDAQLAGTYVQRALQRARTHHLRFALVDSLRVAAQLAILQQRWADAQAALQESLDLCRAMPYPYAEAKALYVYGQLHMARGATERAHAKLVEALGICEQLGEGLYRPHIERALATVQARVQARV